MTRRELLRVLAAAGMITAAGLWIPGQKTISIPSSRVFTGWVASAYSPSLGLKLFESMGDLQEYKRQTGIADMFPHHFSYAPSGDMCWLTAGAYN